MMSLPPIARYASVCISLFLGGETERFVEVEMGFGEG
jgi:hypothetical protein